MSKNTFETSSGYTLRLKPVREPLVRARLNALRKEYTNDHPELNVPIYKAKTIAGDVQDIPLDADSLTDPSDPIATKVYTARWNKHMAAVADWEAIAAEQEYLTWLMLGVECDLPEGWEAEIEAVGVNLPDDPLQRKALWLHYMAVAVTKQQLLLNDLRILSLGNVVSDDQVESFRNGARSALAREARAKLDDALAELAEGPLVDGATPNGTNDGESVGADTEPVGSAQ
jgi:hypothetical protein